MEGEEEEEIAAVTGAEDVAAVVVVDGEDVVSDLMRKVSRRQDKRHDGMRMLCALIPLGAVGAFEAKWRRCLAAEGFFSLCETRA